MMRKKRMELNIVAEYMMIDGEIKEMTPEELKKTDLPDRCQLALTEMKR